MSGKFRYLKGVLYSLSYWRSLTNMRVTIILQLQHINRIQSVLLAKRLDY